MNPKERAMLAAIVAASASGASYYACGLEDFQAVTKLRVRGLVENDNSVVGMS